MTTTTETKRCPDCYGTGVKSGITQMKRPEPCPTCDGEGAYSYSQTDDVYDPTEHTVEEVLDHIQKNPDQTESILKLEEAGKARKGVLGSDE